jgi:hypothetical protein
MPDKTITCSDCRTDFLFSEREQEFYEKQGFTDPKRCKACRDAKKARQANGEDRQRRDR